MLTKRIVEKEIRKRRVLRMTIRHSERPKDTPVKREKKKSALLDVITVQTEIGIDIPKIEIVIAALGTVINPLGTEINPLRNEINPLRNEIDHLGIAIDRLGIAIDLQVAGEVEVAKEITMIEIGSVTMIDIVGRKTGTIIHIEKSKILKLQPKQLTNIKHPRMTYLLYCFLSTNIRLYIISKNTFCFYEQIPSQYFAIYPYLAGI